LLWWSFFIIFILLYQIHQILLGVDHQSSTLFLLLKLVSVRLFKLGWDRDWLKLLLTQHFLNILILLLHLSLLKSLCPLCTLFQCVVLFLNPPRYIRAKNQEYGHNGCMPVLFNVIISCEKSLLIVQKRIHSLHEINRLVWCVFIRFATHDINSSLLLLLLWLWLDLFQYLLILIFGVGVGVVIVIWFHIYFFVCMFVYYYKQSFMFSYNFLLFFYFRSKICY